MNNSRRKEILSIADTMADLETCLAEVISDESEAFENLPESIQDGERGENMQNGIDDMEDILSKLEELKDRLIEITEA